MRQERTNIADLVEAWQIGKFLPFGGSKLPSSIRENRWHSFWRSANSPRIYNDLG